MSRRAEIQMSDEEVLAFLDEQRVVTCATHGVRGWPHLMPLWYVVRDTQTRAALTGLPSSGTGATIWAWTFAKSQKVKNLERDSRATLQVEAGEAYDQLRGVMLECETIVHRDVETVLPFGMELMARYGGGGTGIPEDVVRQQAVKRVALEFVERRRATWDHRKLGGVY